VEVGERVDARKVRFDASAARQLLEGALRLHVSRGRKTETVDLRKPLSASEADRLLLGPTGNLRAPTARVGRTLLVGFDDATWSEALR
jgi:hypothetical protein